MKIARAASNSAHELGSAGLNSRKACLNYRNVRHVNSMDRRPRYGPYGSRDRMAYMLRPNRRSFLAFSAGTMALAQDKSVAPGINDNFKNPSVNECIGRLESESREPFIKRNEILAATGVKTGDSVADIGAGTGLFTGLFASKVGPKGQVYAVDIAASFLSHIIEVVEKQGLSNITPVMGSQASVNLPANSIDMAFICDTYHHFEYPQKTLASLHKALKSKGRVIVVEFHKVPGVSNPDRVKHTRESQEELESEMMTGGFHKVAEPKPGLAENYMVVFAKK